MAEFITTAAISAAMKPCKLFDISLISTSIAMGIAEEAMLKISNRSLTLGKPILISLSRRPGRLIAGSMASTWELVATKETFALVLRKLSIKTKSNAVDCLSTSETLLCERLGARTSTSSSKIIDGAQRFARSKASRSLFSALSFPMHDAQSTNSKLHPAYSLAAAQAR